MRQEVVPLALAPWFTDLELQRQDSALTTGSSHAGQHSCVWECGSVVSCPHPSVNPRNTQAGRTRNGGLATEGAHGVRGVRGVHGVHGVRGKAWASPGCPAPGWKRTAASRSGSGREKRGQARRSASRSPFLPPPLVPRSGAAHLLSKGSNVLIEGIGGADVATWG